MGQGNGFPIEVDYASQSVTIDGLKWFLHMSGDLENLLLIEKIDGIKVTLRDKKIMVKFEDLANELVNSKAPIANSLLYQLSYHLAWPMDLKL